MARPYENILCLILAMLVVIAGCSANARISQAERPKWEPASGGLTRAPEFGLPEGEGASPPPPPFNASDFAMELSRLSSRAAADIVSLRAEAEIEASFPGEASAMLEEVSATLRSIAGKGYEPLELELAEEYGAYAGEVGSIQDTIRLGESMEYVIGRDLVGYYQMNSTKIGEMKKAYWSEKLDRLRGELAAERSRFNFTKQAMLLAQAAEVGARQRAEIKQLELALEALAMDYANRVKSAIEKAAEPITGAGMPSGLPAGELDSRIDEFEADFNEHFERAKLITGG